MQVSPFLPSLEFYPRNSLLASFLVTLIKIKTLAICDAGCGQVKEERRRLRRVVLDLPTTSIPYVGAGLSRPLPPGEGGVSRTARGKAPNECLK